MNENKDYSEILETLTKSFDEDFGSSRGTVDENLANGAKDLGYGYLTDDGPSREGIVADEEPLAAIRDEWFRKLQNSGRGFIESRGAGFAFEREGRPYVLRAQCADGMDAWLFTVGDVARALKGAGCSNVVWRSGICQPGEAMDAARRAEFKARLDSLPDSEDCEVEAYVKQYVDVPRDRADDFAEDVDEYVPKGAELVDVEIAEASEYGDARVVMTTRKSRVVRLEDGEDGYELTPRLEAIADALAWEATSPEFEMESVEVRLDGNEVGSDVA